MPSSTSINWTPWIIAGIMGLVVVLVITGVIGYFVYRYYSGKKLPTPVGDLTITKAPYFDFNAAPAAATSIVQTRYKDKNFYGRFGYRAVKIGTGTSEKPEEVSNINWLDDLKIVHLKNDPQDGGFEFKMPKQDNAVITHPDISYQLMVEYYETSTITGSPVGPLAIHDTIASNADPLVFQESTSETVNLTINAP